VRRPVIQRIHTRFGRAVTTRDIDDEAIGIGGEPTEIAGVVVAELARGCGADEDATELGLARPKW
jgi:hypothetical protein